MEKLSKRDRFFWIFLILSVLIGFIFPSIFKDYTGLTLYIIPTIIGILFLKVDIVDILLHIKKPLLLFYICFLKLIAMPLITYVCFSWVQNKDVLMGLVLLSSLPTGVSSAVFTDIMKGRTSLNLTFVILTNLLSIFTIPLVFYVFNKGVYFQSEQMFLFLLALISIPFFIAKFLKRGVFEAIKSVTHFDINKKLNKSYNIMIIILLCLMIIISISFKAETILQYLDVHLQTLGILFLAFILFQIFGYFSAFWLHKGEKLAISNTFLVVNNILGIVIAIGHFSGPVVTVVILSFIPWNFMIIAKHWYKRYLP